MATPASKRARTDESFDKGTPSSGLKNTFHGDIFQLRLLMLFLTRGLRKGYCFELGTEMPEKGFKFDDLIFTYENPESKRKTWRFLQAKHKFDEFIKIKASDLLNETDGDFSLKKYFRSYRDICKTLKDNEELEDCIIGTNIGFHEEDLTQKGIKLVNLKDQDAILCFDSNQTLKGKIPARYKIQDTPELHKILEKCSDMHYLADELLKCGNKKKKLELRCYIFKTYHFALVNQKVLDLGKKKFHENFIADVKDLSPNAKQFRKLLCNCQGIAYCNCDWKKLKFDLGKNFGKCQIGISGQLICDSVNVDEITKFLGKLVFAVNLPNETQLGRIINSEMGTLSDFNVLDSRPVSNELFVKMLDWFKEKSTTMLSSSDAESRLEQTKQMMMSLHATGASIGYRNRLCKWMGFNQTAIEKMTEKLKSYLCPLTKEKVVLRIATNSLKCTAIKIVHSLTQLIDFKKDDSYLMIQSDSLREFEEKKRMRTILEAEVSHYLLVVVCNDNDTEQKWHELIPDSRKWKGIIIIGTNIDGAGMQDKFSHGDLDRKTKSKLKRKKIQFQGFEMEVKILLDKSDSDAIIDFLTFQELMSEKIEKLVKIPAPKSFLPPEFVYVERKLEFSTYDENFNNQLAQKLGLSLEELTKKCRIDPFLGNIEWSVDVHEQLEIWKKMREILKQNSTILASTTIRQEKHFVEKGWKGRIMIISNGAGMGKSTILSHYFNLIKCKSSDHWVIRIDLVKHTDAISSTISFNRKKAIEFLLKIPCITGSSSLARSMLKRRLNVAGRVVLMLDGFDEISSACQDNIIQFIKAICRTKLERLYVTTRPHLKYKLEDQLFQLAFQLKNFSKEDQVNYLTGLWKNGLKIHDPDQVQTIRKFAISLASWIERSLNDKEKDFIGIPLQCRMLAECYQSKLENVITNGPSIESAFNDEDKLSLSELYHRFMERKATIFQNEKVMNPSNSDCVINDSKEIQLRMIATRLLRLAIETIFINPEDVKLLWQDPPMNNLSEEEHESDEKKSVERCIRHGLVDENGEGGIQFLHRTFAEYLVAELIFKGFNVDDRKQTKLLDSESVSGFLVIDILAKAEYEGVRIFLDSMLHEIVVKKQTTWQDIMNESGRSTNPSRLQKFARRFSKLDGANWIANLSDFTVSKDDYEEESSDVDVVEDIKTTAVALPVSMVEGNANIFKILWDCLKATNEKQDVQVIACKLMADRDLPLGSTNIFIYLLDIYEDADDQVVANLFRDWKPYYLLSKTSKLNCTEQKNVIRCMFLFMEKHQNALTRFISTENLDSLVGLMKLLMHTEFLVEERKELLQMLSRLCDKDQLNDRFLEWITAAIVNPGHERKLERELDMKAKNLLITLREIGRVDILAKLSSIFLRSKPRSFRRVYYPVRVEFSSLTSKDSYGMTLFHQAAARGDDETIARLRTDLNKNGVPQLQEETDRLVDCMTSYEKDDPSSFTPFLLALCCNHSEVCDVMFDYLKRILPLDELCEMTTRSGVFGAVEFAFCQDESELYRVILETVKKNLGQTALIGLLNYSKSLLIIHREKSISFFKAAIETIDDYEDLANYLSQDKESLKLFWRIKDNNVMKELVSLKGSTYWVELFLTMGTKGFEMLVLTLLKQLNKDELFYVIKTITSVTQSGSIWANHVKWARSATLIIGKTTEKFLGHVAYKLGQDEVMKLLLHDDGNGPAIIQATRKEETIMNEALLVAMMKYLTLQEKRDEIRNLIDSHVPDTMQKFIISVLFFIEDFKRDELLHLIEAITYIDIHTGSVWSRYLDRLCHPSDICKFLKCVSEKLGEEDVIKLLLHNGGKGPFIEQTISVWSYDGYGPECSFLSELGKIKVREAVGLSGNSLKPSFLLNLL